ncbi:hypothetical protein ACTXT7_007012 [Hymenolepis weldensis]
MTDLCEQTDLPVRNINWYSPAKDGFRCSSSSGDAHQNSMKLQKTKKVFSNFFFGKHSKKGRGSGGSSNTSRHPLPPSQLSLPPASVQQASLSTNPRIDSLPPPHPAPMADISSECSS